MTNFTVFLVLITIVCFLLIVVIMVQNPKGGGLSSAIGGSQQLGGVQKTTDFLDKSTWTLGGLLIVLVLLSSLSFVGDSSENKLKTVDEVENVAPKSTTPSTPAKTNTPATPEKK
jgi:preprotein translocase subunit SecG